IVRRYREPLESLGLTYTQYIVMMILWEYGDMTEGDLGKIIHLESGTLAPLLKRLEKQGLILRSRPESNERKLFIELTDRGREMRAKAEAVPGAIRGCIPLEDREMLLLRELLKMTLTRMEETKEQETK
ncbi:MAG: MarR family transcriptional regulator, partial [Clostridia bacterium]|nr:MarR family transcriptional regulator [Clostridia bacterium]